MEYSTCKYTAKLYCINQNKFAYIESTNLLLRDYKTVLKIIRILFMSTIQTRNMMDDKIHQNQFSFVANAHLFDSSESNEISLMSNIVAADDDGWDEN